MGASIPVAFASVCPSSSSARASSSPMPKRQLAFQQLHAGGEAERGGLAVVRQLAQQRAHPPPVVRRRDEVGALRPLRPRAGASARRRAPRRPPPSGARAARRARRAARRPAPRSRARPRRARWRRRSRELGAERHLLRQRMLEGVLGHRVERLLVDELGALAAPRAPPSARRQAAPPPRASSGSGTPCRSPPRSAAGASRAPASRSMRAASTACTVAGTSSRSTGVDQAVGAARALEMSRLRSATAPPPR